jgi:hypothetical protein
MATISELAEELAERRKLLERASKWNDVSEGVELEFDSFRRAAMKLLEAALPHLAETMGDFELGELGNGHYIHYSVKYVEPPAEAWSFAEVISEAGSSGNGSIVVEAGEFTHVALILASDKLPGRTLVVAKDGAAAKAGLKAVGSVRAQIVAANKFATMGQLKFDSVVFLDRDKEHDANYRSIYDICRSRGTTLFVEEDTGDRRRRTLDEPFAYLSFDEATPAGPGL